MLMYIIKHTSTFIQNDVIGKEVSKFGNELPQFTSHRFSRY